MRYLKTQTFNRRMIYDDRVALDVNNTFTTAASNAMIIPKSNGSLSSVQTVGMLRYNTTSNEIEVYSGSPAVWRTLRYKESGQITQQNLGAGDAVEVYFGPLNPAPPTTVANGAAWSGSNIFVVVENVLQLFNTNYTVVQNPASGYVGWYLQFSSAVPNGKIVTVLIGFDQ